MLASSRFAATPVIQPTRMMREVRGPVRRSHHGRFPVRLPRHGPCHTRDPARAGGAADRGASRGWTAHHPGPGRRPGGEAGNGGKGGNAKGGTGGTGRKGKHHSRTPPTPKLATIHPIRPRSFGCPLGAAACLGVFAPIRERGAAMIVRAARTRLSPTWSGFAMPSPCPPRSCPQ